MNNEKIILIDASNLFDGGGLAHLKELTHAFKNLNLENIQLVVIGNKVALEITVESPKILKKYHHFLEKNIFYRTYFRKFKLHKIVPKFDILFDPGGGYFSTQIQYITMSQNMLVFEKGEAARYGFSWMRLRLWLLNKLQTKSINKAKGTIFISNYAKNYISKLPNIKLSNSKIIHHGATELFVKEPRIQNPIENYSKEHPFRLLYVSIIDVYKHHIELVKAINIIRKKYPVEITFVGGNYPKSLNLLNSELNNIPNSKDYIHYIGKKSWEELRDLYHTTDMFVFASSCENMPNILIEAMSAGLPIVCSNKGPMPEFLNDAGEYFDPENVTSIVNAIEKMIVNEALRSNSAQLAFKYSKEYSWKKCAKETIDFLLESIENK